MIKTVWSYHLQLLVVVFQIFVLSNSFAYQGDFDIHTSSRSNHEASKEISLVFKSINDIFWVEKNREFRFQGKMYDVRSIKYENGVIEITCELDEFETAVNREEDQFSQSKEKEVRFSIDTDGKLVKMVIVEAIPEKTTIIQHCELFPIGYKEIDRPPP